MNRAVQAAYDNLTPEDILTAIDRCQRAGTPGPEVADRLRDVYQAMTGAAPRCMKHEECRHSTKGRKA
jgi:hypothetical protein